MSVKRVRPQYVVNGWFGSARGLPPTGVKKEKTLTSPRRSPASSPEGAAASELVSPTIHDVAFEFAVETLVLTCAGLSKRLPSAPRAFSRPSHSLKICPTT